MKAAHAQLALALPAGSPAPSLLWAPAAPAVAVAAMLNRGGRIIGLTAGQFSFLDLVAAFLQRTGPASLRLATWSLAERDVTEMAKMKAAGMLTSAKLFVDAGLPRYQPSACEAMRRTFGSDAICGAHLHAKCAVISGDGWQIAIRTSMNLNRNPRWESFDIDDSPEIAGFLNEHFDAFEAENLTPYTYSWTGSQDAFGRLAAGERSGAFSGREMMEHAGVPFNDDFPSWVHARLANNRKARSGPRTVAEVARNVGASVSELLAEMEDGTGPLCERAAGVLL